MPVKLCVSLARKVGEPNFGSRGASVDIEIELESGLVSDPTKLRERIRQMFDAVRTSLVDELNGKQPAGANSTNSHARGNGTQNGNGRPSDNGTQPRVRAATSSQIRAIHAIARSQKLDLEQFLRERFGRDRTEDLTIKEASGAIDDLKRKEK